MMRNLRSSLPILVFLTIALFSGCAKDRGLSEKALATVNGENIYLQDFKKELALRVRQNPSFRVSPETLNDLLDSMIDRKLIIQEAIKEKLSEEDRFVQTIQNFWEQTLIRDFIEFKNREFEKKTFVTDKEIADYYLKIGELTTFNVIKNHKKEIVDDFARRLSEGEPFDWDMTVKLRYDEVPSETFLSAFDLDVGKSDVYKDGDIYYLIQVMDRESLDTPALNDVYDDIKERIRQRKLYGEFEGWLQDKRKDAKIDIKDNMMKEVY
ncbi:MAG: SurA N-terminal domain-containing protein [Candidatus Omnitrophica bacterium]|nr:SurA N-terminal domain-containing protein [Candidatus Omnitrophota bacterium]